MQRKPPTKAGSKPGEDHEVIARAAKSAGDRSVVKFPAEEDPSPPPRMNLYYIVTPENTFAIIAAPDLETAQGIPPYSNWRDLMAFGGWDIEYGKQCKIVCVANPSTLDPNSTPGVLLAGGMGFYSERENGVKFI